MDVYRIRTVRSVDSRISTGRQAFRPAAHKNRGIRILNLEPPQRPSSPPPFSGSPPPSPARRGRRRRRPPEGDDHIDSFPELLGPVLPPQASPSGVTGTTSPEYQRANSSETGMTSEETGGETQQFSREAEQLRKKDALSAEFSGSYAEKDPQMQKSGRGYDNLDAAAQATPASSGLPGCGEGTVLTSGSQPYDPRTNYLSPRPQFLRYNPERLREIYLRRERELRGAEGDSSSEGTPSSSLPSPLPKQEEDGLDLEPFQDKEPPEGMSDGEDDPAEEEKPSCCNLVWKILLLLGILLSITAYISSMYSSSTLFQSSRGNHLQIKDALQETAGNISTNSEMYPGVYMNTCMNAHLDSCNSDGLCKFSEMEREEPHEEDESMVNDGSGLDDVRSNAKPHIVGGSERSVGSVEESEVVTQTIMSEDSDFTASYKNQDSSLVRSGGEDDEYAMHSKEPHDRENIVADDSNLSANNENLNADVVLVEGENEGFICTDIVYNPGDENRQTGDTISEEHMEDVMVATEIEETGGMTLKLDKPAEAPQRQTISGNEEKDGSFEDGSDFGFYGMKVVVTVLMVLGFATSTFFSSRRLRKTKTPVMDSSASFPFSGRAYQSSLELPTTEKPKTDFDFLANSGRSDVHEIELFEDKTVDSSISTDMTTEFHETHPPTVELLGEFSVAELGLPKTEYSSLGKKTARTIVHNSQSPEASISNSLATVDQSPLEFSATESTPRGKADQEKLGMKQDNRHKHGAAEAVLTPLRRSSRIRNRLTSP